MRCLVVGAGGFIGGHLVKRLIDDGHRVCAVDLKPRDQWHQDQAWVHGYDFNTIDSIGGVDLRIPRHCEAAFIGGVDWVFNLAADMGGMGYIESHKINCMRSVLINTNLIEAAVAAGGVQRYFFSSSACVYNDAFQAAANVRPLREVDAYPAMPEDGYGWEKLFSERMCRHYTQEAGLQTRVARYHNVYGPNGTWTGGREKAPAAICRKVAHAVLTKSRGIAVWGDGEQTRSFMHIDDCIEGTLRLMQSDYAGPVNIGSSQLVTINQLVDLVCEIADVNLRKVYVRGPQGVRGRNSDNALCRQVLNWEPSISLKEGLESTYAWIYDQLKAGHPTAS